MILQTDFSRRFVLPTDAPYLANLAALWARDPKFARAIEAADLDASPIQYIVEPSKSGDATAFGITADQRKLYLHSRYAPQDEVARAVDKLDTANTVAFYVQGFGLGYHIQQLFDRTGDDTLICIFEPDLAMLKLAMHTRDLVSLIETGRVQWFWEIDKAAIFNRLVQWQPSITMGLERLLYQPASQFSSAAHDAFHTHMQEFKAYAHTSINTLVLNGKKTAYNVASNLPLYVSSPSISRLKDRYKGSPAIIVSAGPSLRKNKHLLNAIADKAVIIAVQTTLRPLLEMGIEPHFVTALDYHSISTRFWEGLPPTLRTELIAEPKASGEVLSLNPGPLSILGNEFADKLLAEMSLDKARLRSGATVAHLAFYLAEYLGCDPIIFIGQDLGFSDGLYYTPGTSYEDVWRPETNRFCTIEMKQWEQIVRERNILRKVPDYQGRPMYTEERLYTYLQHFERDFQTSNSQIIDGTEGGVLKRGATPMPLANAIETFCTQPLAAERCVHPGADFSRLQQCEISLNTRREEAIEVENLGRETLPLLEEIRDHLDDQMRVNHAIAKLDTLRAKMARLHDCYTLVLQLSQQSELQRFRADRKIAAAKVAGAEKQKRQVQRDIDNVRSVIEAAIEFQLLMDQTLTNVRNFRPTFAEAA